MLKDGGRRKRGKGKEGGLAKKKRANIAAHRAFCMGPFRLRTPRDQIGRYAKD